MPSQAWLNAWSMIRKSDEEGLNSLKQLYAQTKYGINGPAEMISGTMTGDGQTTLMHQAVLASLSTCNMLER